jgi:drug/metabolite transporter (DMT)-like permease
MITKIHSSFRSRFNESESKGIYFMLGASFLFAFTGLCVRALKGEIGPIQSVFFRNAIGFIYIAWSLFLRKPQKSTDNNIPLLVFRGVIGTFALYAFFYGVTHIGLGVATTYQQTYPIFLAVMSYFVFHEKLDKLEWAGVFIGFGGVALVFLPQLLKADIEPLSHIIGLSNSLMTGLAYLSIRGLKDKYDVRVIVFVFMICGIIMPMLSLFGAQMFPGHNADFIFENFVMPQSKHIIWIVLMGIAALGGQIFLTKAFLYNKTGLVGATGYSNIIFAVTFGLIIGDSLPKAHVLAGIGVIIFSGILISGVFTKK